jgi:hypothetical protein
MHFKKMRWWLTWARSSPWLLAPIEGADDLRGKLDRTEKVYMTPTVSGTTVAVTLEALSFKRCNILKFVMSVHPYFGQS